MVFAMHKSRLGGLIIDCRTEDLESAGLFWSKALGHDIHASDDPKDKKYVVLKTPDTEIDIEIQKVKHDSRVHIDIETDDIEAEALRLEKLGAWRVKQVKSWLVMRAPTGQHFCLVDPQRSDFERCANHWD